MKKKNSLISVIQAVVSWIISKDAFLEAQRVISGGVPRAGLSVESRAYTSLTDPAGS